MDLRRIGFISIIVLIAQYVLGIAANLWVTIGMKKPWSHIGDVGLLGVHGILGVAIVLMALVVLGRAFEGGSVRAKMCSIGALVGVAGALGCGVGFVSSGGASSFSFGMALGWALALLGDVGLALER